MIKAIKYKIDCPHPDPEIDEIYKSLIKTYGHLGTIYFSYPSFLYRLFVTNYIFGMSITNTAISFYEIDFTTGDLATFTSLNRISSWLAGNTLFYDLEINLSNRPSLPEEMSKFIHLCNKQHTLNLINKKRIQKQLALLQPINPATSLPAPVEEPTVEQAQKLQALLRVQKELAQQGIKSL